MANLGASDVIAALVALPAGAIALAILLVDEVDEAFANVYSTAMSVQNLVPHLDRRIVAVTVGALATLLAGLLDFSQYQSFLFLIGSVFVPLIAVAAADFFFVSSQRWDVSASSRFRIAPVIAWALRVRRLSNGLSRYGPRLGRLLDFGEPVGWIHRSHLAGVIGGRDRGRRPRHDHLRTVGGTTHFHGVKPRSLGLIVSRAADPERGGDALVHQMGHHAVGCVFQVVAVIHPHPWIVGDEGDLEGLACPAR